MSNLKKSQIANFKPKKGLLTSPSLIYLSTPPGLKPHVAVISSLFPSHVTISLHRCWVRLGHSWTCIVILRHWGVGTITLFDGHLIHNVTLPQ